MDDLQHDERGLTVALRTAGQHLDAPEVDVTAQVVRRLAGGSPERAVARRVALAAAVLMVVTAGSAAVAALVVPGVQLRFADPSHPQATQPGATPGTGAPAEGTPAQEAHGLDAALDLGRPVSRAQATTALGGRTPWLLGQDATGPPRLYLHPQSGVVSAAYAASSALPELGGSGLGLVLSQFPSPDVPWFEKTLDGPDGVETVRVGDRTGLWVEGPHDLAFLPDGATRRRVRQADNVLLWSSGGLTLRMESALDRDAALGLAATLTQEDG